MPHYVPTSPLSLISLGAEYTVTSLACKPKPTTYITLDTSNSEPFREEIHPFLVAWILNSVLKVSAYALEFRCHLCVVDTKSS